MQIIAESQLVKSAPYVHLGYISASSAMDAPAAGVGLMVALLGTVLASRLKRVETPNGDETRVVFRRSVLGFVGLVILGLGIFLLLVGVLHQPRAKSRSLGGEPSRVTTTAAN